MFNTSMHWVTFFISINLGLLCLLQFFLIYVFKSKLNVKKSYFLLNLIFFLYVTLNGLLPYHSFPFNFILQYVITYGIAILMCIYLVYYLYSEFNYSPNITILKLKNTTILLIVLFVFAFLIPYFYFKSLSIARNTFLIIPTIIASLVVISFYKNLKTNQTSTFFVRRSNYAKLSILSIVTLPILTWVGDYQYITFPVVTLGFVFITVMEIDSYIYFLLNKKSFDDIKIKKELTLREKEVFLFLVKGLSYSDISKKTGIKPKTVSKHASNIFKKLKCNNISEFRSKYEYSY